MATILDGKACAEDIYKDLENRIGRLKEKDITPGLAILSFGEKSGQVYVKNKIKTCERLGIYCEHHEFDFTDGTDIQEDADALIEDLNKRDDIHGIIVQLPIPDEFYVNPGDIIEMINPAKDVDGLTQYNVGRLWCHNDSYPCHYPCTPKGIMRLLNHYDIPLEGKNVVIIGRSDLVGKPLAAMMLEENATVTICHSKTEEYRLERAVYDADILIVATGNPFALPSGIFHPDRRYDAIIDVGINRHQGKIIGDIKEQTKAEMAKYYTPVPGGVGPMTVAMLMENVVRAAERKYICSLAHKGYIVV